MTRRILFTGLFAFFLLFSGDCFAQSTTGTIRGSVTDPSGAVIPSASIVVTSSASGSKSATSGADGAFALDHLAPGRYTLSIMATGFAPTTAEDIMVFGGKTTPENVMLPIAVDRQQVQVSADTATVDTNLQRKSSGTYSLGSSNASTNFGRKKHEGINV